MEFEEAQPGAKIRVVDEEALHADPQYASDAYQDDDLRIQERGSDTFTAHLLPDVGQTVHSYTFTFHRRQSECFALVQ